MGHGVDLDLERGIGQCRHLHEGRSGKVAGKELAPGLPYLLALGDVGDKNRDLDDIGHTAASCLDEMADLAEDLLCLSTFVAQGDALTATPSGHAGDIGNAVHDQAIRPGAGGWIGDLWAGYPHNAAHRFGSSRGEPSLTSHETGCHDADAIRVGRCSTDETDHREPARC